ncbi:MAG: hypothetical protein ACRDE6_04045 [Candidatus Limnocylindria bacterium]
MRSLVSIATVLLLVACDALGVPPLGEPRICTQVGCESGVHFKLDVDLVAEVAYEVSACVDDICDEGILEVPPPADGPFTGTSDGALTIATDTDSISYSLGDLDASGRHRVSITVRSESGDVIAEFDGEAEFERTQPNGPGCEPVCWLAEIAV